MKTSVKLKEFESCDFQFEPELDVRNKPQIIISNLSKECAMNIDVMKGNYHCLHFFNIRMNEGLNESPLIWDKSHFIHLFPKCSGVHFFVHSWEEVTFDFEIEGVNGFRIEAVRGIIEKKELPKVAQQKNKWGRTSGIRDEGY